MNKLTGLIIILLIGLTLAQPAVAKDSGFYFGGSIGSANVSIDDIDFDENDFAWKLYGGFTLGSWLGIEGGYVDFNSGTSGLDVFAMAGLPLGPVRVFGKLGGIYWDSDVNGNSGSDDGFDAGVGVGLEFSLFSVALRAEVEYFDALDDLYLATIGATWTF
jgi:hypothetical protein